MPAYIVIARRRDACGSDSHGAPVVLEADSAADALGRFVAHYGEYCLRGGVDVAVADTVLVSTEFAEGPYRRVVELTREFIRMLDHYRPEFRKAYGVNNAIYTLERAIAEIDAVGPRAAHAGAPVTPGAFSSAEIDRLALEEAEDAYPGHGHAHDD